MSYSFSDLTAAVSGATIGSDWGNAVNYLLQRPLGADVLTVGANGLYATPALAMAAASSGDVVLILPGTYDVQELVVKSGVDLRGMSRRLCKFTNSVDHTTTVIPAGNNAVSDLDIAAYAGTDFGSGLPDGYTYGQGESVAIGLYDTATPVSIERCRIGCGTDGIYTHGGHLCTGNGTFIVRDIEYYNMTWDICRVEFASGSPVILIDDNRFVGSAVDNETNRVIFLIRCIPKTGILYVQNCLVNLNTYGPATGTNLRTAFLTVAAETSGANPIVRSYNNSVRIVDQDNVDIVGIQYQLGAEAADYQSLNDRIELVTGGTPYSIWLPSGASTGNFWTTGSLGGGAIASQGSYLPDALGSSHHDLILPTMGLRGERKFAVAAMSFDNMNWNGTNSINRLTWNQFANYTFRADDKITVTAGNGAGASLPAVCTVTARGTPPDDITVTVDSGTMGGSVSDGSYAGHFLVRDVHCGLGDTATLSLAEDVTVHVSDTQFSGQKLTMIFAADGSDRTVTWGTAATSGLEPTGGATLVVAANTTAVVRWVSNGTKFIEIDRVTGATP